MCLLYPPANISGEKFEGGDIIFYNGDEIIQTIEPSKFENWTFVVFKRKTLHRITPVTKGERYVLKTPIYSINKNYVEPKWQESDCEELSS